MTRLASGGKKGIFPPPDIRPCINISGATLAIGDLVLVDTSRDGTPTPANADHGFSDSAMASVVRPQDATALLQDRYGFFGSVVGLNGGGVDGAIVEVCFNGRCQLNVTEDDGTAGTAPVGRPIYADLTDQEGHIDANSIPASKKLIGMTQETLAQGATALIDVDMWGIAGIGHS